MFLPDLVFAEQLGFEQMSICDMYSVVFLSEPKLKTFFYIVCKTIPVHTMSATGTGKFNTVIQSQ